MRHGAFGFPVYTSKGSLNVGLESRILHMGSVGSRNLEESGSGIRLLRLQILAVTGDAAMIVAGWSLVFCRRRNGPH